MLEGGEMRETIEESIRRIQADTQAILALPRKDRKAFSRGLKVRWFETKFPVQVTTTTPNFFWK